LVPSLSSGKKPSSFNALDLFASHSAANKIKYTKIAALLSTTFDLEAQRSTLERMITPDPDASADSAPMVVDEDVSKGLSNLVRALQCVNQNMKAATQVCQADDRVLQNVEKRMAMANTLLATAGETQTEKVKSIIEDNLALIVSEVFNPAPAKKFFGSIDAQKDIEAIQGLFDDTLKGSMVDGHQDLCKTLLADLKKYNDMRSQYSLPRSIDFATSTTTTVANVRSACATIRCLNVFSDPKTMVDKVVMQGKLKNVADDMKAWDIKPDTFNKHLLARYKQGLRYR